MFHVPPLAPLSTILFVILGNARADDAPSPAAEAAPAPVEAGPPVEAAPAPPPPDPQRVFETTHLERTPLDAGWTVHAGDHTFNAVEFAAVTGDNRAVEAFARRERGAYRATRVLVVTGSLLASVSVAELVAWRASKWDDPGLSEDHLWRSAVLGVSATVPLAFCTLPVRLEAGRRAQIAASYDPDEVDTRIATFNTHLREQLGLVPTPTEGAPITTPTPTAVILPPPVEAP